MKFAESLRKGVLETPVGAVINRFKIRRRRTTLFFEDILAGYIKLCEASGHAKMMTHIGEKWSFLAVSGLTQIPIRRLPTAIFFKIMNNVWTNIGILENIAFDRDGDKVKLLVTGNSITRIIGRNAFEEGCFRGILKACMGTDLETLETSFKRSTSEYVFRLKKDEVRPFPSKQKERYNKLNTGGAKKGFTLKEALRKNIFTLKSNRVFFRGRSICNSENTLFHIIGNENVMLDKVPAISYGYFKEIIKGETTLNQRLLLLKNLLQIMGWGVFSFICKPGEIRVDVDGPPYGLQQEPDNWKFLAAVILGYLWLADRSFVLREMGIKGERKLVIVYTKKPSRPRGS